MDWLNANSGSVSAIGAVIAGLAATATVIVTIVLVKITGRYADETQKYRVEAEKSRQIAEDTLAELKRQHRDDEQRHEYEKRVGREALVVPLDWSALIETSPPRRKVTLDIVNLGPGSAKDICIAAVSWLSDGSLNYLVHEVPGLPPGRVETVSLDPILEGHPLFQELESWPTTTVEKPWTEMMVRIEAKTILDEEMPARRYTVGYFG